MSMQLSKVFEDVIATSSKWFAKHVPTIRTKYEPFQSKNFALNSYFVRFSR